MPTAPGVCSRCVCSLMGQTQSKNFKYGSPPLGRMSRHFHYNYKDMFSVYVFMQLVVFFLTIKDVYDTWQAGIDQSIIKHTKSACLKKKCIVGRRHLACRRELAEGEHWFRARCKSNICGRFASLFRIALSVERPYTPISSVFFRSTVFMTL